jgi:hypothetical protein
MLALAGWIAPAATMIAAIMTAANLGTRITGLGFAVFAVGAMAWIVVAATSGQQNLLISNVFLLVIDGIGMWRWLGRQARYDAGAREATDRSAKADAPTLFPLTTLAGMAVRDATGQAFATVVDAMAARTDGTIAYLVVGEGGAGGVGERLHALGWHEVTVGDDGMTSRLDAAALGARGTLHATQWPASARSAGVA